MADCHEHEIAIEQRLHGVAPGVPDAELDQHLASCASCRAFAARSHELEQAMASERPTRDAGDWRKLERGLQGWRRDRLGTAAVPLATVFLMAPFVGGTPFGALAVLVVVAVSVRLEGLRLVRMASRLAAVPGELVAFLRDQLDAQIRRTRRDVWLFLGLGIVAPASVLLTGRTAAWHLIGALLSSLLFVALALQARLTRLPRLLAERADLV
jgi:hypothetical protein